MNPHVLLLQYVAQTFKYSAKTEDRPLICFQEGKTASFLFILHLYFLNSAVTEYMWIDLPWLFL